MADTSFLALPAAVEWRRLREGLWVGRAGGAYVGMIEHGSASGYTFTDPWDGMHGGYATLGAAQKGAAHVDPLLPPPLGHRSAGQTSRGLVAVVTVAAGLAVALLCIAIPFLTQGAP